MSRYYAVNASELIHDVIGEAFRAAKLSNYTQVLQDMEKPERWQAWTLGMVIISACSFSAPLGMLALPCLSKSLYERTMIFLIALGIGALSGSSMFIMIPQAFHLTQLDDFHYHSKSAIIVGALYTFFSVDRILQYALELRKARKGSDGVESTLQVKASQKLNSNKKEPLTFLRDTRRQAKRKVHTSTIVSIMSNTPKIRARHATDETTLTNMSGPNSRHSAETARSIARKEGVDQEKEKAELAEEVEIAMLNNSFARTFSTRRHFAVMSAVDAIELRDANRRESDSAVHNDFLEAVNNGLSRNQNHFLDVVNHDVSKVLSAARPYCVEDPPAPVQRRTISDDEVSVSVKIVEKHVIDPSTIEVASVAYMIIFGSSANNFVDGMSMGAAFSDSLLRGMSIGVAVVSQQFPQELGTLAILINSGLGFRRAMLYNLIPIFLSYLGFACGVLLDNVDEGYDDYIFSISSGMYLYIFLGTLIPEIRDGCNELMKVNMVESLIVTLLQFLGIAFGICFMFYMSTVGDVEL